MPSKNMLPLALPQNACMTWLSDVLYSISKAPTIKETSSTNLNLYCYVDTSLLVFGAIPSHDPISVNLGWDVQSHLLHVLFFDHWSCKPKLRWIYSHLKPPETIFPCMIFLQEFWWYHCPSPNISGTNSTIFSFHSHVAHGDVKSNGLTQSISLLTYSPCPFLLLLWYLCRFTWLVTSQSEGVLL